MVTSAKDILVFSFSIFCISNIYQPNWLDLLSILIYLPFRLIDLNLQMSEVDKINQG